MDLRSAEKLILQYDQLVGQEYDGKELSVMVVAPITHDDLFNIVFNLMNGVSSYDIYRNYSEFDVVLLFDYQDLSEIGFVVKESLIHFLEKHPELKTIQ